MHDTGVGVDTEVMDANGHEPAVQSIQTMLQQALDKVRNPESGHSSRSSVFFFKFSLMHGPTKELGKRAFPMALYCLQLAQGHDCWTFGLERVCQSCRENRHKSANEYRRRGR